MSSVELTQGLDLGESEIGEGPGDPVRVVGASIDEDNLRGVRVAVEGEAGIYVQLAPEVDGLPGEWGQPGASLLVADLLAPGEQFAFWARVSELADAEGVGVGNFDYVVRSRSFA